MLKLLDDADYFLFTGGGQQNVFQVIITKKCPDWKYRIMDFLEYEASQNKDIIVAVSSDDLDIAKEEYSGHSHLIPNIAFKTKE